MSSPPASTCRTCSAPITGRFCANCGTPAERAACVQCGATLSTGAKFCHRCGTEVGAAPIDAAAAARGPAASLPWAVAALALLALVALVAGQRFAATRGASAAQVADDRSGGAPSSEAPFANGAAPGVRAPDISSMSPRERADRLFDRVMRLVSEGKLDSAQFFAPMAMASYQSLGPLDNDLRYDYGRIAEVSGAAEVAKAQADSILRSSPTHLLGLVLAIRAAAMSNDTAAMKQYERRLLAAESSERAKHLPEYERHQNDIASAIADAKKP